MIEKTSRRLVNIWAIIDLPTGKKMKISGCSPKTARRAVIKSALRVEHERESEWKDEGKKRMMIKTGAKKEERNNIHRRVPRSSLSLFFFCCFLFSRKKDFAGGRRRRPSAWRHAARFFPSSFFLFLLHCRNICRQVHSPKKKESICEDELPV